MELKVEIGFNELLSAIKQLPDNEREILKQELEKKETTPAQRTEFQEFLLKGPVMSDEQYKEWKETRKSINQWRTKK